MEKIIRILAGLAIVQVVFVVIANMGGHTLAGQAPNQPLLSFDKENVDTLIIKGKEKTAVKLIKKEGQWLTAEGFPAAEEKVSRLIEKMHDLKHGLPVANSDTAMKRFKVANDVFERHIELQKEGNKLAGLYVGSGAGARQTHVRNDEDIAVYAVALGTYDAPDTLSDWRDKSVLTLNQKDIDRIEVLDMTIEKVQDSNVESKVPQWKSAKLPEGKMLNQKLINESLSLLASLRFDKLLGQESKPEYGLDKPVLRLKLTHKNGEREYVLGAFKGKDDYVLKVSDRPEYFLINGNSAQPIVDKITRNNWIADSDGEDSTSASTAEEKTQPAQSPPEKSSGKIDVK